MAGSVLDSQGHPITGAIARLGFDRFGTDEPTGPTDAEGRFVLKNCNAGKSLVTVQADGFSPQFQELVVGDQNDNLEFRLEAGHTLRIRVVDIEGKPISGAIFVTDTWRGFRTLEYRVNTDAEGRVTWNSAPPDAVLCDVLKAGYMAVRKTPLSASSEEQVVTMHPQLEISGRVTDARSGTPIKSFQVRWGQNSAGRDRTYWSSDEGVTYVDGEFSYKFDEPTTGRFLQVIAPGYKPQNSRLFRSTEGKVAYDFELQPGKGPSGLVVKPNGEPAPGAEVGLATQEKRASLSDGHFALNQNRSEVVKTDAEGRFEFAAQDAESYLLLAVHESGFAEATQESVAKSERMVLQPWGRLRGRVLVGDQPDVGREVYYWPQRPDDGRRGLVVSDYGYRVKTDDQGRFQFDRVIPGPGTVSRAVVTQFLGSSQHTPGWQTPVEIREGETTEVVVGGAGRPITGRIVLDREPDVKVDWTTNEPVSITAWDRQTGRRAESYTRYVGNIDKAGRFQIPDVSAGSYRLTVPVNNHPSPSACGAGAEIGKAEYDFVVSSIPGGRSNQMLDLGDVTAALFDTLDVGEVAPDFVAEQLSGGALRLRDYRGKLVVLDFWATWCGPCLAELPTLRQLHERFGEDPRFALLSLTCDDEAATAQRYVEEHKLAWRHAHVLGTQAKAPRDYTVWSLPATFVIGPNGRILAKNVRGEDLVRAVDAALEDEKLFTGAQDTIVRFPVVRFNVPEQPAEQAGEPAVVVLDDTDPTFEKNQPHRDRLRALKSDGEELWSHTGFNAAQTVGGVHRVAIDRKRGRIYACEDAGHQIVAFDLKGNRLWQVQNIEADVLMVDERTGDVWCSGGPLLNSGETVVFDENGNERAAFPYRAIDMAYDPHTDGFWLVGYETIKLARNGEVLFRELVRGWCCASVSVNPKDGSVWIAERDHPDVADSKNRLWLRHAGGEIRRQVELGDVDVFVVECLPESEEALISGHNSALRRVSLDGKITDVTEIAATNIVVSPTTSKIWLTTKEAVLNVTADGNIEAKSPFAAPSNQAWIAAF